MNHVIHWFRRDLRLEDNHSLHQAIQTGFPVKCIFIFDDHILSQLPKDDKRVQFIYNRLSFLKSKLNNIDSDLWIYQGKPLEIWNEFSNNKNLQAVFTNRDYEPYAQKRDKAIYELLKQKNIPFKGFKDQVIFEKSEILSKSNTPYTVFTPYMKTWKATLNQASKSLLSEFKIQIQKEKFYPANSTKDLPLKDLGFENAGVPELPLNLKGIDVNNYDKVRDTPSLDATTRIGTALRFGTISVRNAVKFALEQNDVFLNELIWREFFMQILYHFPQVQNHCFRQKYEGIKWRNNEEEFKLWCQGKTGYPIVDAGMRELNQTGFMHNRVRMIVASFLVKDLLIDWRWGEAYFAKKLIDYDLSANNGNWQWAAGTGTDAAPYFRIFNPESQQKKFDPDFKYIKKWVSEFGTKEYPQEIVNHKKARERCLVAYKKAIQEFE